MRLDAHQHFWNYTENAADYVWMTDDLADLQRDFLPSDLAPLRAKTGIEGTIAVQAREKETETDFLLELAKHDSSIRGVVGWIDLCAENVEGRLEGYSGETLLKGHRMLVHDRLDPNFADSKPHLRGVSLLQKFGLTYDLLLRTVHLPSAIRLVDHLPNQPFVVDHIAKPKMDGSDWEAWESGIRAIAERPHVLCKLSGLVTEADWDNWKSETFTPYLDVVLETFGTDRLMIGTDWPVCTLAADYKTVVGLVTNWAAKMSEDEQEAIFGGNCARFYSA